MKTENIVLKSEQGVQVSIPLFMIDSFRISVDTIGLPAGYYMHKLATGMASVEVDCIDGTHVRIGMGEQEAIKVLDKLRKDRGYGR